jgi:hypothetical protein
MLRDVITRFPTIVRRIVRDARLSADEIRAVLKTAFLAAEIDLDEDPEELASLQSAARMLWEHAGYVPEGVPIVSPLPLPIDREARLERVHELASDLRSTEARELAYSMAYLSTVADLAFAPVESALLEELERALGITPDRAAELVATAAEILTPGVTDSLQP